LWPVVVLHAFIATALLPQLFTRTVLSITTPAAGVDAEVPLGKSI
jgi:hypothetical protein